MPNVATFQIRQQTNWHWTVSNTGEIYIATYGRGIWKTGDYLVPTGVPPVPSIPAAFTASVKVWPNPMSSDGHLSFFVPKADKVVMEIYDLTGKRVYFKDMGRMQPGSYEHTIDVEDLRAGTYFVNIRTSKESASAKFVVVK
jgi:myo-inositol-hexaphosphate 3-phosphohydrolase